MLKITSLSLKKLFKQQSTNLFKKSALQFHFKNQKIKVAVILSGCGVFDGTEIHEASAVVVHLTRLGLEPVFYAPKTYQTDVINHHKGKPMNETRCMLKESARIARGSVCPLNELEHCLAEAIVVPGGFGVAKSLTTFAEDKDQCAINQELYRVLHEFHSAKKPMLFLCISAILPARLFPSVKVTLGKKDDPEKWPYHKLIDPVAKMGAEVEPKDVDEFCCDEDHMVLTTPAFLYNGTFFEIFCGIGKSIEQLNKIMD